MTILSLDQVKTAEVLLSLISGLSFQVKHAASVKRGKTLRRWKARENTQVVVSAGKYSGGDKRGKTLRWCLSAEKYALGDKRGK